MTREQFSDHWRNVHAPLIRNCPDFRRHLASYTQYHMADAASDIARLFGVSSDFDGIAVLSFRSAATIAEAFAEPAYIAQVRPDEFNFVDLENSVSFTTDAFAVL